MKSPPCSSRGALWWRRPKWLRRPTKSTAAERVLPGVRIRNRRLPALSGRHRLYKFISGLDCLIVLCQDVGLEETRVKAIVLGCTSDHWLERGRGLRYQAGLVETKLLEIFSQDGLISTR